MATLSENITRAISDFDAIQSAIIDKGVAVPPGTPTSVYGDKIAEIPSGGEWTRPADRPAKPDMQDNTVLMLYGVAELPPNEYALSIETSGSGYTVDWGDGTVDTYANGEKAEHGYDFNDIDAPVNSDGYKMVWITVRPVDGDITLLDTAQVPERFMRREDTWSEGWYTAQVFEMYIQCPEMSEYRFGEHYNEWTEAADGEEGVHSEYSYAGYPLLDIFSLDINLLSRMELLLAGCMSLQKIEKLRLDNITEMRDFMSDCSVYNQLLPHDAVIPIAGEYFMGGCLAYNQPFPSGIRFDRMESNFLSNSGYNHPLPVDSHRLNGVLELPRYTLPLPTIFPVGVAEIIGMRAYAHTLTLDLLDQEGSWLDCYNNPLLRDLVLLNVPDFMEGINVLYNQSLGSATFISIFEALPDRSGLNPGWIDIRGCYGAYQLTDDDIAIANNKNWTVGM